MNDAPAKRRPRWFRFSLRALLVVVTVFCVWLGLETNRAFKQAAAVKRIKELGGYLQFDYERDDHDKEIPNAEPWAPKWLRTVASEDFFRRVHTLDFSIIGRSPEPTIKLEQTNEAMKIVASLPDLVILEIGGNDQLVDAHLANLGDCRKLSTLYLYWTNVTGPGLRHLANLRSLESLSLSNAPLTDEGLRHLINLPRLRWLQLSGTRITDAGLAHLSNLKTLEELQLSNTDVTDAGLVHLQQLTKLKQLSLSGTNVTSDGVAHLQKLLPNCIMMPTAQQLARRPQDLPLWPVGQRPSREVLLAKIKDLGGQVEVDPNQEDQPIVELMLFDSDISDAGLLRLLAEMPELRRLNTRHLLIGDAVAEALTQYSQLEFVALDDSRITDKSLRHLATLPKLRELTVTSTRITDQGLAYLKDSPSLRTLVVGFTRVTKAGIVDLKAASPKCGVNN
jgi:internalin A